MARTQPIYFQDRMGYVGEIRLEPDQLAALLDLVAAPVADRLQLSRVLQDIAATYVADVQGEHGPLPRLPMRAQSRAALDHVIRCARKAKTHPGAKSREELRWRLAGLDDTAGFLFRIRSADIWKVLGGNRRKAFEFPALLADHPDVVIEAATWAKERIPADPGPIPDPDLHLVVQRLLKVYLAATGLQPTVFHYNHALYDGEAHSRASEFCKLFFNLLPLRPPTPSALMRVLKAQIWSSQSHQKVG